MKKVILQALFAAIAFSVVSVSFAQTDASAAPADKAVVKTLTSHREEIQRVIKTEDTGIIRGFDFGTSASEIKNKETGTFVADGKDFAIYKVPINETEYAEVIYYLDNQKKVNGFGIEFIITEQNYKLEENIVQDFHKYFTERYGKHTVNAKNDEVWDAGEYTVEMGDASDGGSVLEIEIEFFPKTTK